MNFAHFLHIKTKSNFGIYGEAGPLYLFSNFTTGDRVGLPHDINLSFWRGRRHTHGIIQHPPVTWLQVCNKGQAYNQGDSTGQ